MVRIAGVEIPAEKRIEIGLTYIYGIGRTLSQKILHETGIDPDKRGKELTDDEVVRLQRAVEKFPIEGALRKIVSDNIKRLKQINSYRGMRHAANLPVRGQRTRSNARTKRGKRMTVGALRKKDLLKLEAAKKAKEKKEEKK